MAKKIYVGNLSTDTKEENLRSLFSEYGNILSLKIVTDQYSGISRGFGFVEMENESAVKNAISSLNGQELDGKNIKVNEAYDKRDRGFRGGNRRY
ncbi:MAG: RNA-binding protein [Spirochaetales bacterium]|nr:RNA-binding protein [Spirochaetales bacterium]